MPMEQLQELVLERVRHHVADYLEPGKPGQELVSLPRKNRNRAKQTELERLQGEILRRRKAMQELYLDKSGGVIGSAQFMELNRNFLHEVEDLEKRCAKLEESLGEADDMDGHREKLKQCLSDVREVKALKRELACLLIEKVVIYPIDAAENTRKIEIDWKFGTCLLYTS